MGITNNQHYCGRPFDLKLNSNPDVPTTAGSGRHFSDGIRTTIIDVAASATTVAASTGSSGSVKLLDFPEAGVVILGCTGTITLSSTLATDANLVCSIGTTAAGTDNFTLLTTEANLSASTACAIASNVTSTPIAVGQMSAAVFANGTSTPADVYLNFASSTTTALQTITAAGKIAVTWVHCGDPTD